MKNTRTVLKRIGVGVMVSIMIMPLTACASETPVDVPPESIVTVMSEVKGIEEVNFSAYKEVKEPLEDAKKGMFKVNLVTKDGKVTRIDKEFQNGIKVLKGRTAVSMFDMSETVPGITLSWDQASRVATAKNEGNVLKYPINRRAMSRNGEVSELEVAATVDSKVNRTYLPFRSLMENLGYDVEYHEASKIIDILEKGATKIDHSKDVAEKPATKPTTEKPAGVSGEKSKVIGEYTPDIGSKTVTHSLPQMQDMVDTNTNLKAQFKGKTIIKPEGRSMLAIYDEYKVLDASYYYSDINPNMLQYKPGQGNHKAYSMSLETATFADSHREDLGAEMQTYAFEDTNGNIYLTNGFKTTSTKDIYTGKTIKHVYKVSNEYKAIIKVTLQDPQPIK